MKRGTHGRDVMQACLVFVTCNWRPSLCLFSFLQRHFSVFALSFPGSDALSTIYSTILTQHLKRGNFPGALQKSSQQLINLALALHLKVAATFLPTAIKFHYNFNLRDFSNVFQVSSFSIQVLIVSSCGCFP